jgi:hypothetical protein
MRSRAERTGIGASRARADLHVGSDRMNIQPDIDCPHCGPVIICPHTAPTTSGRWPDPAHNPTPDSRSFLQRVAERHGRSHRPQRPAGNVTAIAAPGTNPKYVGAAIRADLERLAAAHEGTRNGTLIAVACNVFEFVKAGHADETTARAELERIATAIGLGHGEIQTTLRSAWQRVQPRPVPAAASVAPAYVLESPTS